MTITTTKFASDQLPVTTTVATPGVDTQVPTEKAVRDAIASGGGIPIIGGGGTANAITADYTPDITLSNLKLVAFVAKHANTSTTPTFTPDGLTTHTITKQGGLPLAAGDIAGEGAVCILEYNLDNTRWELLNPASSSTPASLKVIMQTNFR
jgi:hypothetical protein